MLLWLLLRLLLLLLLPVLQEVGRWPHVQECRALQANTGRQQRRTSSRTGWGSSAGASAQRRAPRDKRVTNHDPASMKEWLGLLLLLQEPLLQLRYGLLTLLQLQLHALLVLR